MQLKNNLLKIRESQKFYELFWFTIFICVILFEFSGIFIQHLGNSANFYIANDDALPQITPFQQLYEGKTLDYFDQYYLSALHPIFYKLLYFALSELFEPVLISKILPYFLLIIFLCYTVKLGKLISSNLITYSLIICYLSAEVIFSRMVGGLPHSFGFLIIIAGVYYLLSKQNNKALITAIIGTGFYPACAVFILFSSLSKIFIERSIRIYKWPIILTVLACFCISLPSVINSFKYGGVVSAYNVSEFPEAQEEGRNNYIDIVKGGFVKSFKLSISTVLFNKYEESDNIKILVITILSLVSLFWLSRNLNVIDKVLILLFANCFILFCLAKIFSPLLYFPERYLSYTFPIILPIIIIAGFSEKLKKIKWSKEGILLVTIAILLISGSQISSNTGLSVNETDKKTLFEFVEKLPENSIIAGYPKGVMDGVKYFSKKDFYFNYETSVPIHQSHILEIRERAKKFFNAYYATDILELKRFAEETGVTHIIADESCLDLEQQIPYYKPFDAHITATYKKSSDNSNEFILNKLKGKAVFRLDNYFILELKSL